MILVLTRFEQLTFVVVIFMGNIIITGAFYGYHR